MCGHRLRTAELRILPGGGPGGSGGPPPVRLLREFKGPTVRRLSEASAQAIDRLPGQLRSVARALRSGDLAAAEERLERALGSLVEGPGHRPARLLQPPLLAFLLWLWLASLVVAVLWLVW